MQDAAPSKETSAWEWVQGTSSSDHPHLMDWETEAKTDSIFPNVTTGL